MEFILKNIEGITDVASDFLKAFPDRKVFAFHGDLGAGKTTFIKALCTQLDVKDAMSSPSFSIVNEYRDAHAKPVYHFDLYRIRKMSELEDIGFEEYTYSGHYCFIEWPEKAEGMLPEGTVEVFITSTGEERKIMVAGS